MDFAVARRRMVENQLRTNGIVDPRVIAAMARTPREQFVPDRLAGIAYVDEDLEIGKARYLMEPLVLARLLQGASIGDEDVVLEIGSGTGFAAAVMSQMASTVVALECDPSLAAEAQRAISELELDNVAVIEGPLQEGYERGGPYNVILFSGAVAEIPEGIANQLAEGGHMAAVISSPTTVGRGILFSRIRGHLSQIHVFDAFTPMLPGFEPAPTFTF